jgi:heat shock protein HslJ
LLTTIDGVQTLGGVPVTAVFGALDTLTGSSGCNDYDASYTAEAGQITISELTVVSDIPCRSEQAATEESAYLDFLSRATNYTLDEFQLTLCNSNNTDCLEYVSAATLILENVSWVVEQYQNDAGVLVEVLPDGPAMTAIFHDSLVQGYGGCSNYQASYTLVNETVTFQDAEILQTGVDTGACPEERVNQQALYLKAIGQAQSYAIEELELHLFNANGEPVAIYTAAALQ